MKLQTRSKGGLAIVLIAILATMACIHKQGAITPMERIHTYNAALAESNNALEKGAEAVVSSGLMTAQQAAPLIGMTGQVATIHLQVTAVLQAGSATTANVASIQTLVNQIKASIQALPPATLGIKNPKSQNTFQADVAGLSSLADALLTAVEAIQK